MSRIWAALRSIAIVCLLLGAAALPVGAASPDFVHDRDVGPEHPRSTLISHTEQANSTGEQNTTVTEPSTTVAEQGPGILEIYPNTYRHGNEGEFLVVSITDAGNWTVRDNTASLTLPDNHSGPIAISPDPPVARTLTDVPVIEAPDGFRLAQDGETIRLEQNGSIVDEVTYGRAPEGTRWLKGADSRWVPIGLEPRAEAPTGSATVTTFVLPDAPESAIEPIKSATDRVYVGGYTLSSKRVATALIDAHERGVDVRVVLEGEPVGGVSDRQAAVLDTLVANGVEVQVFAGEKRRFEFHHPKYAVVDDRAIVLTENWKPSGTGGNASRGWGVVVDSGETADELAAVFRHDTAWDDTTPWEQYRARVETTEQRQPAGSYPANHAPRQIDGANVTVLTAPGNAEHAIVDRIDGADSRVEVIQPSIDGPDQALTKAVLRAAERGVSVRVLVSDAWYDIDRNRALAEELNGYAADRGLPFEMRVDESGDRYQRIHAKGVLVDDTVILGSMNWNDNAAENNREVAVAIDSPEAAAYYRGVFDRDFERQSDDSFEYRRVGLVVLVGIVATITLVAARKRLRFAD